MPRSSGRGIDVIEGPRLSRGLLDDVPGGDYNKGGSEELGAPAKPAAPPGEWAQGLCTDMFTGARAHSPAPVLPLAPRSPSRPRLTGASAAAGCGYCVCPCGCGAPEAVRNVGNHLARHGGTATCNMFPCVWKRWFDFKGDLTCEVAASGTCCYVCCPCVYVPSNRELFVSRHKLEGGCCEDCASPQLLARVSGS